jgi:hypothetical protein
MCTQIANACIEGGAQYGAMQAQAERDESEEDVEEAVAEAGEPATSYELKPSKENGEDS